MDHECGFYKFNDFSYKKSKLTLLLFLKNKKCQVDIVEIEIIDRCLVVAVVRG